MSLTREQLDVNYVAALLQDNEQQNNIKKQHTHERVEIFNILPITKIRFAHFTVYQFRDIAVEAKIRINVL